MCNILTEGTVVITFFVYKILLPINIIYYCITNAWSNTY